MHHHRCDHRGLQWQPVPYGYVVGGFVTRSKPVGEPQQATRVNQLAFILGKAKARAIGSLVRRQVLGASTDPKARQGEN